LQARIQGEAEFVADAQKKAKRLQNAVGKIRYHVGRIQEDENSAPHWNKIEAGIHQFIAAGGAPSNREVAESLLPIADTIPDDLLLGVGLQAVLEYVDELAAKSEEVATEPPRPKTPIPELLRARDLLRGKCVVLIGGQCRQKSKRLIERELELKELRWITSRPHESISGFEPEIIRHDTALVVLMIRWCSHSYEGVKRFCVAHAKPFVRLPGGYHPNQIAYQIIEQQGEALANGT